MQEIEVFLGKLKKRNKPLPRVPRVEIAFWQRAAQNLHVSFEVPDLAQVLVENNGPEQSDTVEIKLRFPLGVNMQKLQKEVGKIQALFD